MLSALYGLARPMVLSLEPERAHELMLRAMELGIHPHDLAADPDCLAVDLWGLRFPNPLAIAAGFDKNARVVDAVLAMGCGWAEVGTTTPLPQPGNPPPRVFRLVADGALVNRLGFNNEGHEAARRRIRARRSRGVLAVNIGANKESRDRTADYVRGLDAFYDLASVLTVNISSPNTPGLRDLQAPAALDELLGRLVAARDRHVAEGKPRRPIIVKISPDIAEGDISPIVERIVAHGIEGISVANTTLARPRLVDRSLSGEAGGLSGRPLFHRSTVMLAKVHRALAGRAALIGIGGIDSGAAALAKIEAGASLLQLYTGLVFEGPGLIADIKRALAKACREKGLARIGELSGTRAAEWASKPLEE